MKYVATVRYFSDSYSHEPYGMDYKLFDNEDEAWAWAEEAAKTCIDIHGDEIDDEWTENRSSADVEELFDDETFEEYIPYFRKIYNMPTGWLWQVK